MLHRSSFQRVVFWPAALLCACAVLFGSIQLGKVIGAHILATMLAQHPQQAAPVSRI